MYISQNKIVKNILESRANPRKVLTPTSKRNQVGVEAENCENKITPTILDKPSKKLLNNLFSNEFFWGDLNNKKITPNVLEES